MERSGEPHPQPEFHLGRLLKWAGVTVPSRVEAFAAQLRRAWGLELQFPTIGQGQSELMGMEAISPVAGAPAWVGLATSQEKGIPQQRGTHAGQMDPDLMRTARTDRHRHQVGITTPLQQGEATDRRQ